MGKTKTTKTTIDINGTKYDATTGERINVVVKVSPSSAKPHVEQARTPAKHVPAHAPTHTQTLMRRAVKKPSDATHFRAQTPADLALKPFGDVVVSKSAKRLDIVRLHRSQNVSLSSNVHHFSSQAVPTLDQIAVPTQLPSVHHPKAVTANQQRSKTTADLLEQALQHATSHEQPYHIIQQSRSGRGLQIAGSSLVALLLVGAISYQYMPKFRVHMASAKAGFAASLPNHQPAGYRLGQVNYSAGEVATQFKSNSSSDAYTLTQKASLLDSSSLLQTVVVPVDPHYRSVQAAGETIYLYGSHNAAWVNAGVAYQIQSNGTLSDRQLVEIATSL